MKIIKNSKDITTLEVGDVVVFGNLKHEVVCSGTFYNDYYLDNLEGVNDAIFKRLNINKKDFVTRLGIAADYGCDFPEVKSLEALTAIVSALFKKYEKQNELPKTWEEFCERNKMGDKKFCLYHGDIVGIGVSKNIRKDTTLMESPEEAQAFRALMQLRQLRKAYVKDWEPELGKKEYYGIVYTYNGIKLESYQWNYRSISFPTHELAKQFLTNFKDLLEVAKPLL